MVLCPKRGRDLDVVGAGFAEGGRCEGGSVCLWKGWGGAIISVGIEK